MTLYISCSLKPGSLISPSLIKLVPSSEIYVHLRIII